MTPATTVPVPPRTSPPRPSRTPRDILDNMTDDLFKMERSLAGYNYLSGALNTINDTLPDGERAKGLPIFHYKASVDGVKMIDVVSDLKEIDPSYLNYILAPMCDAHGKTMLASIDSLIKNAQEMYKLVQGALTVPEPKAT